MLSSLKTIATTNLDSNVTRRPKSLDSNFHKVPHQYCYEHEDCLAQGPVPRKIPKRDLQATTVSTMYEVTTGFVYASISASAAG